MMSCYYPTTTVIIDDDKNFLNSLSSNLGIENCKSYSSPISAIGKLNSQSSIERIKYNVIKEKDNSDISIPGTRALHFDMRTLHNEIYNEERFSDVSVIIVDYFMDEVNGIDVCKALKNHPAKKILLTGGADMESLAIDALNKQIIHQFISKLDPLFPDKIRQMISLSKDNYFSDLSMTLMPHISPTPLSLYQHLPFVNFVHSLQKKLNIVEYYVIDTIGSCLMLDADGNQSWFIIKHETNMKDFENLAHYQEAAPDLIRDIENRALIPFFLSDDDFNQPVTEWKRLMHSAKQLPCAKNYYYTICTEYKNKHILKENIVTYNSHRKTMKA